MNRLTWVVMILAGLVLQQAAFAEQTIVVQVSNPLSRTRMAAAVTVSRQALGIGRGMSVLGVTVPKDGHNWPRPFQLDDLDEDGKWDELFFQANVGPKQRLPVALKVGPKPARQPRFKKRVDALIDAAPRKPWVVYKPVWESELMGYCMYGTAQIDLLGKIQPRLALRHYFGKNPVSQHKFTPDFGMDFLNTRNTMGAHAIFIREPNGHIARPWTTNGYAVRVKIERDAKFDSKVIARGPLRAIVRTRITNWQTDRGVYECELVQSIHSLQRHTNVTLKVTRHPGASADLQLGAGMKQMYEDIHQEHTPRFLTAVARDVLEAHIVDRYVARAIVTSTRHRTRAIRIPLDPTLKQMPRNGPNYGLLFPKGAPAVRYAYVAAWEKDGGITSIEQWRDYLTRLSEELEAPLAAAVKK